MMIIIICIPLGGLYFYGSNILIHTPLPFKDLLKLYNFLIYETLNSEKFLLIMDYMDS